MESGLMGQGIAIESEGSVQTLLSTLPGLGSKPCHSTRGDPQVEKLIKRSD